MKQFRIAVSRKKSLSVALTLASIVGAAMLLPRATVRGADAPTTRGTFHVSPPPATAPSTAPAAAPATLPAIASTSPSASQPADMGNAAKLADIRHLLDLTGSLKFGQQSINQIIATLRYYNPDIPADVWDQVKKDLSPQQLTDRFVAIYDSHLNDGEVKDLIHFYESPTGRKLTQLLPQINIEQAQAGRQWGGAIVGKLLEELRAKGFSPRLPGQAPPPQGNSGGAPSGPQ